jgi:hypothetical protein
MSKPFLHQLVCEIEILVKTYGELVGPNNDSLSLPILFFLLLHPVVESSPSTIIKAIKNDK